MPVAVDFRVSDEASRSVMIMTKAMGTMMSMRVDSLERDRRNPSISSLSQGGAPSKHSADRIEIGQNACRVEDVFMRSQAIQRPLVL